MAWTLPRCEWCGRCGGKVRAGAKGKVAWVEPEVWEVWVCNKCEGLAPAIPSYTLSPTCAAVH